MAVVGEMVLSATLQVLFERIASSRPVMDFIRGQRLNDALLKKLEITYLALNAVLIDAEDKQFTNPAVKKWLDELKDATYAAEDLLDEIVTDALRCKSKDKAESHSLTDRIRSFVPSSLNPFAKGINSKIEEILDRLEFIAKDKDVIGLKGVAIRKSSQRVPTTSLIEESSVFGRDDDREEIIKSLLSDNASGNGLSVITIVGMGGIGKTTLAQLVYNDDRVKDHFDLKVWAYVSEEFDVSRVTKTILGAVTSSDCNIKDLDQLQVKLKESLTEKKFLLILDDVWNEKNHDWEVLLSPFRSAKKGSKIIATTRNENVASIMRTTPIHHLKLLQDEDCWSLFAKRAFHHGNSIADPNLEPIGREIVKKCNGLPLAAKTLGGLLRFKGGVEEWEKILNNDIWDFSNDKSGILPALRLSYHDLPSHLKRCFTYCSIFPKGFEFKKEELVLLWMAEGFLQEFNGNKRMEEIGKDCVQELISRSFLQQSSRWESEFIMHDLINDLAKFVAGKFLFRLEDDNSREISKEARHMSYRLTYSDVHKTFEAFNDAKCLRTFLPSNCLSRYDCCSLSKKVLHDLLSTHSCLRVLSLSHYRNTSELPESIGSLKHLRYLDLSFTAIKRLPESTSSLFNLQTLMLVRCWCLIELPSNMRRLINLRHLDVSGTRLKQMPEHMSRLRSLQTLSTFIVGNVNGSKIAELREFWHLGEALHIMELQNVVHGRDALLANLKEKKYLDELVLEWSAERHNEDSQNERDVLDNLNPHANLKKLTIKNFGGTRFSDWLGDPLFLNLVSLCLTNCKYCFSLPPLGQLPFLKDLSITGFDEVVRVDSDLYGKLLNKPFLSLETLRFGKMLEWEEWVDVESVEFPRLRELYLLDCPKITGGLPTHLPSLTKLKISECQELVASLPWAPALCELTLNNCEKVVLKSNDDDQMGTLPSRVVGLQCFFCLQQMAISNMSELKELPPWLRCSAFKTLSMENCEKLELFQPETICDDLYFASLKSLTVINSSCDSLKSFPLDLFPNLYSLQLICCENLESLSIPEELHVDLTCLNSLYIKFCPKMVSFPKGGLPTPNLTHFSVSDCKNLKSLPERMCTLLPSLQHLEIDNCPELESFPEGSLPSNLRQLCLFNCDKLMARRRDWGLQRLSSLKNFSLRGCEEVESFPEEWLLPSTLTWLSIGNLKNLKWLDKRGLQYLTSLESLWISNCPKLQCLPEREGLPPSISELELWGCPLLEKWCQREKGQDWPKIAHIPNIVVHKERIP